MALHKYSSFPFSFPKNHLSVYADQTVCQYADLRIDCGQDNVMCVKLIACSTLYG